MTDYEIAEKIAAVLWGDTGFRCRDCCHDQGYHLVCRPRMFECKACSYQQSVVAGTIMEGCKVPLKVWYIRADYYERGVVPTSTELAREAEVARSTAWLVNQKWMASLGGEAEEAFCLTVACRRPRKPLAEEVCQDLRAFWAALRSGEASAATVRVGDRVTVGPAEGHDPHPVGQHIAERLQNRHRGVCIRWMARWVAHYVELCREAPRKWLAALLAQPPMPLVRLAPALG